MKRTITTLRSLKEMLNEVPEEHLDREVRVLPDQKPYHGHGSFKHQKMGDTVFLCPYFVQAVYENHDGQNMVDGVVDADTYVYITFEWNSL